MPQYKTAGGYPNTDPHYVSPQEEAELFDQIQEEADMKPDTKDIVRVATSLSRLQAWNEGEYEECPPGYTHESLQWQVDLRVILDFARGVLGLMAEKL